MPFLPLVDMTLVTLWMGWVVGRIGACQAEWLHAATPDKAGGGVCGPA